MIRLFPSRRIQKETDIDFELLSNICTDIFEKGFGRKINIYCRVWKSRVKEQSTMERPSRSICYYKMDFQEYIFRFTAVARFASYNAYYNSKEEKDARKQEKLTTEVMKIYDTFKRAEEKFKRFNLKELG